MNLGTKTQELGAFTPLSALSSQGLLFPSHLGLQFSTQFPGSLVRFPSHLGLQFQDIRHPFLASTGTFTHMKSHGHIHLNKNFVIFKII